jgi:cytochrome c biogenesis factor
MGLMGVCLFILFLFVLFSSGLSGVCARRKHKNIKQSCHRGVSANFLMSGVVFYFLFSWLLVLIAITIFVPGILIRQFACKPLIELDNNKLFDVSFK